DPGYRVQRIELANVTLPSFGYTDPKGFGDTLAIPRFFTAVLTQLRAAPGVDAAGIVNQIPLGTYRGCAETGFMIDGGTEAKGSADYCVVDSAYFAVMGIPLLKGRGFTSADRAGAEQVTVINRQAAEQYWQGVDPIGHRIRPPGMDAHKDLWLTIVGVVADVREEGLDQPPSPQMYV